MSDHEAEATAGTLRMRVRAVGMVEDGRGGMRPRYRTTVVVGGRDPFVDEDGVRSGVGDEADAPRALRQLVAFLLAVAEAPRGTFTLFALPVEDSARRNRRELAALLDALDEG